MKSDRVAQTLPKRAMMQSELAAANHPPPKRKTWMLWLIAVVCAAPAMASYLAYYVFKPAGAVLNYGALLTPQPVPADLIVTTSQHDPVALRSYIGKWLLLMVDTSACPEGCVKKLYFMRQIRAAQGNERERVNLLWLRTDDLPVAQRITRVYADTHLLQVAAKRLAQWLPTETRTAMTDHIYLVDPQGNLIMRFPKDPDPNKMRKDLSKLLKWSGIG